MMYCSERSLAVPARPSGNGILEWRQCVVKSRKDGIGKWAV